MADVFLHVGLSKTGTSTIQSALDGCVEALAVDGVLFPGGRHQAQRLAAYDLVGQRVTGDDRERYAGAFARLSAEMKAYDGRAIIVSEEDLAIARPRHVRRLVRELSGHRVFVVLTVRDLGRTVVSAWQQSVVMGGSATWQEFIGGVRAPEVGAAREGVGFWLRHDLARVLDVWGEQIPVDRIRIVTVPPAGRPRHTLLDRFAAATGLPEQIWGEQVVDRNVSLGAAEIELLRRLNDSLRGPLSRLQHQHVIERGIRPRWTVPGSRRLALPIEELGWVTERAEAVIADLRRRGHPVYGDLQDLLPNGEALAGDRLDEVTDDELLACAEAALVSLALAHGSLQRRYRRAFTKQEGRAPTPTELLGNSTRVAAFRLQRMVLDGADNHRVLAWASRTYLRRSGSRRAQ